MEETSRQSAEAADDEEETSEVDARLECVVHFVGLSLIKRSLLEFTFSKSNDW